MSLLCPPSEEHGERRCIAPQVCYMAKSCQMASAEQVVKDARRGFTVPNSVVLMFVRGWQGGTIHQIAAELSTTPEAITNASMDEMGVLMREAQRKLREARGAA